MNKTIFFLNILFLAGSLYAQNIIKAEIAHQFEIGKAVDEIGEAGSPEGMHIGGFANTELYNQYIFMDFPKRRFIYFDLDFNYLNTRESKVPGKNTYPFVDYAGNIYRPTDYYGNLTKFTKEFKEVYKVKNDQFKLGDIHYVFNDHVIVSDRIIDPFGNILEGKKRTDVVRLWFALSDYARIPELRKELLPLVLDNSLIICGTRLYSEPTQYSNRENLMKYFRIMSQYYKNKDIFKYLSGLNFSITGYDSHDNMYIHSHQAWDMFILSKNMKIIKYFDISMGKSSASNLKVMPNGDIVKQIYTSIYRVKNTWDPISNKEVDAWIEEQKKPLPAITMDDQPEVPKDNPTIKTLITTSTLTEPNDKNAYHPIKAFDNNPKTMWIEAAKGPGLGEYLEVELSSPSTIDGIQIQPGCFWGEYWKQNNRIRQMTIFFNDKKYILNFQDVMKNQGTSFKQPITFTKARFVINDVYKTTNWDDTAISDIWFMKEGKPIELGLGEYAGFLK